MRRSTAVEAWGVGRSRTAYGQLPLQAKTPLVGQASSLLAGGQPVITQFGPEAPLQSITHAAWSLQSKVHMHPPPHVKLHGGLSQTWSQHPPAQVEQSVPHIPLPVLVVVVLDVVAAPPVPDVALEVVVALPPVPVAVVLVPLLVVKLPPMPVEPAVPVPLEDVVPTNSPVCANWSKSCVQPT